MLESTYQSPQSGDPRDSLSPREAAVLDLASQGLTNIEIAIQLGVTVHTVKFHLAAVYRKLGVTNRTEATVIFLRAEWLTQMRAERAQPPP